MSRQNGTDTRHERKRARREQLERLAAATEASLARARERQPDEAAPGNGIATLALTTSEVDALLDYVTEPTELHKRFGRVRREQRPLPPAVLAIVDELGRLQSDLDRFAT